MVGHGEREPRDDDVAQGLARHVHALPETVRAEQHRIYVFLEFFEHRRAWRAFALHKTRDPKFIEKRLYSLAEFLHELVIREQHEGLAVGLLHEMCNPMF